MFPAQGTRPLFSSLHAIPGAGLASPRCGRWSRGAGPGDSVSLSADGCSLLAHWRGQTQAIAVPCVSATARGGVLSIERSVAGFGQRHEQSGDGSRGLLVFDFDVASVAFDYSGSGHDCFVAAALDVCGNVLSTYTDDMTRCGATGCFDAECG